MKDTFPRTRLLQAVVLATTTAALALLWNGAHASDDKVEDAKTTIKQDAKEVGQTIARESKQVGQAVARDSKAVGHAVAAKSKEVGHAVAQELSRGGPRDRAGFEEGRRRCSSQRENSGYHGEAGHEEGWRAARDPTSR